MKSVLKNVAIALLLCITFVSVTNSQLVVHNSLSQYIDKNTVITTAQKAYTADTDDLGNVEQGYVLIYKDAFLFLFEDCSYMFRWDHGEMFRYYFNDRYIVTVKLKVKKMYTHDHACFIIPNSNTYVRFNIAKAKFEAVSKYG